MTLDAIDTETAVGMYLADRKDDLGQMSIKAPKPTLGYFVH